jgi:protoporphyrinogen oxidase
MQDSRALILGGGPAGLAAAYALLKKNFPVTVFEKDVVVGGICKTLCYKGYYFDMGGHRFYTKYDEVRDLWLEVLGDSFLTRPRLSRIYYNKKFFYYPLKVGDTLRKMGLVETLRAGLSFLRAKLRPYPAEDTLEQWVSNRFGRRLYEVFFKTYTEKVWGIPCHEIEAEWAAQRIKGLDFWQVVKNAVLRPQSTNIKTLIEQFQYPRLGPGMMYDEMARKIEKMGGEVLLQHNVQKILHENGRITGVEVKTDSDGLRRFEGSHVISSIPLTLLILRLDPPAPEAVVTAAKSLTFRNLLTVNLVVDREDLFPDNWIYIHEPGVHLGRIQNYKNWSPEMVPDPKKTCLGLEYFTSDHEELWKMSDEQLIELGKRELEAIGLARASEITDGTVCRVPKAYPVYMRGYRKHLDVIIPYLRGFENLFKVGRYGTFKYNNQDHSILMGLYAVRKILNGEDIDIWAVNSDDEYLEEQVLKDEQKSAGASR